MNDAQVIDIVAGALIIAAKLAGPIMVVSLVLGVGIALLQTITQIQEMTLTFVPKLIGAAAVLVIGGSWMMRQFVAWVTHLWGLIPSIS